ncbi:MAG: zinc ribbon domain-containing protein [Pseudomonadota bacterium]
MPLYEYVCEEHGLFEASRPMALFDQPCPCPACGELSPRATALPRLAALSDGARRAHAINERSQNAPRHSRDIDRGKGAQPLVRKGGRTFRHADGSKTNPSNRPWMLS